MTWECSYCPDEMEEAKDHLFGVTGCQILHCDNFFATDWCNYGCKQGRGLRFFLCPMLETC